MPMSNSFEACVQTVRPRFGSPRTNFAKRRMASVGLLGWDESMIRSQCLRPHLSRFGITRLSHASTRMPGSTFDLMSRSTLRNLAGNVFIATFRNSIHVPRPLAEQPHDFLD